MELKNLLWLGLKGISERKMRTALTVLSVVIGVAAIVALISLTTGISASISKSLSSIGPATLYLIPSGSHIFTAADVAEIEGLPNVSSVIPMVRFNANITVDGKQIAATVIGVDNYSLLNALGSISLANGSVYQNSALPLAVVGHSIAFPSTGQSISSIIINEPIYLTEPSGRSTKSITMLPSGILNTYGSSSFISPDTSIFTSVAEAQSLSGKYSYNVLLVQAQDPGQVAALDSLLTTLYGSGATIISVQQIAATVAGIVGSLGVLLGAIAGISLLVAGISILSIMMVSVSERTREIGILKSIGFKKRDVLILFLTEALIVGFIGGVLGVALGAGGSFGLAAVLSSGASSSSASASSGTSSSFSAGAGGAGARGGFGGGGGGSGGGFGAGAAATPTGTLGSSSLSFAPVLDPIVVILAIGIAVFVSIISSLYPAWKAATIDPIKALKTE